VAAGSIDKNCLLNVVNSSLLKIAKKMGYLFSAYMFHAFTIEITENYA